ncbi:hypothetical protein [Paraburkholderia sp. BCC1886]|nr:hypothetical protein [Paraburkholderia sp. BCC1886]
MSLMDARTGWSDKRGLFAMWLLVDLPKKRCAPRLGIAMKHKKS